MITINALAENAAMCSNPVNVWTEKGNSEGNGMNRKERRQQKKLQTKNRENELYLKIKQITKTMFEKINNDSDLTEIENIISQSFFTAYIYRNKSEFFIINKFRLKKDDCVPFREEAMLFKCFVKCVVKIFFELINPHIKKDDAAGQKIINYWKKEREKYYESEEGVLELKQKFDIVTRMYIENPELFSDEEPMNFEDFKKLSKESIKNIDPDKKISFLGQQLFYDYGVKNLFGKKETKDEYWERMLSTPKNMESHLKLVLDNMPNVETYLELMNSKEELDLEDKNVASALALSDLVKYIENTNTFKGMPNFVKFLKSLKDSKHPTIEWIIEYLESQKEYTNPVTLNESSINLQPEQIKKRKYKHDPEKR
jgi:hypothetical protein